MYAGNTNWGGRLSKVDLLIKVKCLVKYINNIFKTKRIRSKLVSTRRSTVLSLPLKSDFPDLWVAVQNVPPCALIFHWWVLKQTGEVLRLALAEFSTKSLAVFIMSLNWMVLTKHPRLELFCSVSFCLSKLLFFPFSYWYEILSVDKRKIYYYYLMFVS